MPKLATLKGKYIPKDVEFMGSNGKMIPNSDFPTEEQVKVDMTYATLGQKNNYMQTYAEAKKNKNDPTKIKFDNAYDAALKKHVLNIENLEDDKGKKIKNGWDLVACNHPGLNDLKQDLFYRICGIRIDEEEDDGPGEFIEGEGKASV